MTNQIKPLLAFLLLLLAASQHSRCDAQTPQVPEDFVLGNQRTLDTTLAQDPGIEIAQHPQIANAQKSGQKKFPEVKISGFLQLDSAFFYQDATNRLVLGDINDGLGFRRARLAAKGKVNELTSYIIELDIAQSQARVVDVWMQMNRTNVGNVRIGRFRQPFGMAELTSIRDIPFLERPVTFSQAPFRQTGIMLFDTSCDESRTWAVSGYRAISDNFGNVYSDNGGYGLAARITQIMARWGENDVFHLGADYTFNNPGGGVLQVVSTNEVFVGQNPNLGPAGLSVLPIVGVPPFVNTGLIAADTFQAFNIESAVSFGRCIVESEARWMSVDQTGGGSFFFPSAYLQCRYMLTGESIPYLKKEGVFGRVTPLCDFDGRCDCGAWELVGRISHIDLNDGGIAGRRMTNFTSGCNWYLNKYTKFQFNWIHSQLEDPVFATSHVDTIAIRAQLDF